MSNSNIDPALVSVRKRRRHGHDEFDAHRIVPVTLQAVPVALAAVTEWQVPNSITTFDTGVAVRQTGGKGGAAGSQTAGGAGGALAITFPARGPGTNGSAGVLGVGGHGGKAAVWAGDGGGSGGGHYGGCSQESRHSFWRMLCSSAPLTLVTVGNGDLVTPVVRSLDAGMIGLQLLEAA